jgi:hypothetical protein
MHGFEVKSIKVFSVFATALTFGLSACSSPQDGAVGGPATGDHCRFL